MIKDLPIKPLQSLCDDFKQDIVDGPFGSELQRKDYITKGIPVLKIQNVKPFTIELKKMDYVSPAKFQELRRHSYRSGDIVMTKLGSPLGVSAIVEDLDEGVIVADLVRIRAQRINTKYLCYHLNSQRTNDFINSMQKGTTRPRVTLSVVRELPIYTPALPEQHRIVRILDDAFDGLACATANAEQNLKNARALFESHLQSVFTQRGKGWSDKTVGEIAQHSLGKMLDKSKNKGEPKPYLRNINVRWFTFDLGDLLEMRFREEEAEKYTAIKGDVLVCEGGYPGRAAIWDEDYPIYFQKALHRVRFHEPEHNKWFVYFLYAQDKGGELRQHFTGTGIQHFTGEVLSRFKLPIPPLSELQRLVSRFGELSEETQRLESIYQHKLAALGELKKSLLHQAFSGNL
jgi:type I restriction enzyme S subunit